MISRARANPAEGLRWLEAALSGAHDVPAMARARALNAAGNLAVATGQYERAKLFHEEAVALVRNLDPTEALRNPNLASALNDLAGALRDMGDYERAEPIRDEAFLLYQQQRSQTGIGATLIILGNIKRDQARKVVDRNLAGDLYADAEAAFSASLAHFQEPLFPQGIAVALGNLAAVMLDMGNVERAAPLCRDSLARFHEQGIKWGIAWCLETAARLALAAGQPAPAARLLGAASELRQVIPFLLPPAEHPHIDHAIKIVREQLGTSTFEAKQAEGRALSLDKAMEEALAFCEANMT